MDFINQTPVVGFACVPRRPTGYTWTYSTLLGNLLATAEEMFGPRDRSYTPVGVELSGESPQTWYPGNRRHVAIQLSLKCADDANRGVFQLAHEVIHLLAPTGMPDAPVVEEGLASLFSDAMAAKFGSPYRTKSASYEYCMGVTRSLYERPHLVRQLRQISPTFRDWTPEFLSQALPELAPLAPELCEAFASVRERLGH